MVFSEASECPVTAISRTRSEAGARLRREAHRARAMRGTTSRSWRYLS